ncbi:MAG: hypothetical protein ACPHT8_12645, partial [Limisphaerales bacterium]
MYEYLLPASAAAAVAATTRCDPATHEASGSFKPQRMDWLGLSMTRLLFLFALLQSSHFTTAFGADYDYLLDNTAQGTATYDTARPSRGPMVKHERWPGYSFQAHLEQDRWIRNIGVLFWQDESEDPNYAFTFEVALYEAELKDGHYMPVGGADPLYSQSFTESNIAYKKPSADNPPTQLHFDLSTPWRVESGADKFYGIVLKVTSGLTKGTNKIGWSSSETRLFAAEENYTVFNHIQGDTAHFITKNGGASWEFSSDYFPWLYVNGDPAPMSPVSLVVHTQP